MLNLSAEPRTADQQMRAIIFYLTTFGHIDGEFDLSEKTFVRQYIEQLVAHHVHTSRATQSEALRRTLVEKYTQHFHEVFETVEQEVKELFAEAVAHDEAQDDFVHAKLKLRCFEIFQSFDQDGQEQLMASIDHLIMSDGDAHPAELKFRAELSALLEADLEVELLDDEPHARVRVLAMERREASGEAPAFFADIEHHYSSDPETIERQVAVDRDIIARVVAQLEVERAAGAGRLAGKRSVLDLQHAGQFLDGHVAVTQPPRGRRFELTVLGDLHGCYSCLKAAVTQARFFERLAAFRADPTRAPEPKLVLLGDYIDRGMFSMNGVLRAVLLLKLHAPEQVVVLRGNHEYFLEYEGKIFGGVKPSEAIDTLKPHVPVEVFREYMGLFDALPTMLLFDRTLFVHGGIPRDVTIKQRYRDLASLNHPELRFQMMWSDPSPADVIPAALQEQSARFAFGRLQAQRFLQLIGCVALIRGHDKIVAGFERVYDDENILLCTVFSAGGEHNEDLLPGSSYRNVRPMALTLRYAEGTSAVTPWEIDYALFNQPHRNGFYLHHPELAFVG